MSVPDTVVSTRPNKAIALRSNAFRSFKEEYPMGTELYMTPALAELWLRYSSPAEMQEWTDHCLPSE